MRNRTMPAAFVTILAALSGCTEDRAPSAAGLANPVSVHCGKLGGRTNIETLPDGSQIGMCELPDGCTCEEWALLRDRKCEPTATAG